MCSKFLKSFCDITLNEPLNNAKISSQGEAPLCVFFTFVVFIFQRERKRTIIFIHDEEVGIRFFLHKIQNTTID